MDKQAIQAYLDEVTTKKAVLEKYLKEGGELGFLLPNRGGKWTTNPLSLKEAIRHRYVILRLRPEPKEFWCVEYVTGLGSVKYPDEVQAMLNKASAYNAIGIRHFKEVITEDK